MVNVFSSITDKEYYDGSQWYTWIITDDANITATSRSYTTTVDADSEWITRTTTSVGDNGLYKTTVSDLWETSVDGMLTVSVYPNMNTSTYSQSTMINIVRSTSSWTYSVPVENTMDMHLNPIMDMFSYSVGRVYDTVVYTCGNTSNGLPGVINKPQLMSTTWFLEMSVSNAWASDYSSMNKVNTTRIEGAPSNNTTQFYLFEGGVSLLPSPSWWYATQAIGLIAKYSTSSGAGTVSTSWKYQYNWSYNIEDASDNMGHVWNNTHGGFSTAYGYVSYYAKSSSEEGMYTLTNTYTYTVNTSTFMVLPSQVTSFTTL